MILPVGLRRWIDEVGDGLDRVGRDRAGDGQRADRSGDLAAGVVDRVRRGRGRGRRRRRRGRDGWH
jgi:hypothetical protein